jgi:Uma2 family endonuclease
MGLALEATRHYTYADYLTWPDDVHHELIDGRPVLMSPAQTVTHQIIAGQIHRQLANQLAGHPCLPLVAPVDVRLPKSNEADAFIDTLVQPDVLIVCDASKVSERGIRGAPDWILEVVIPGNAAHDIITKRRLYEQAGVREYWLVHPIDRVPTVHTLAGDGLYGRPHLQTLDGQTDLAILPGVRIDWDEVPKTWLAEAGSPTP